MHNNSKSRKNRSSSARGGKGRPLERQVSAEGVYGNHRFMQIVGTVVGLKTQVETKTKEKYDGIFTTVGPNFELVLDVAHPVSPTDPEHINPELVKKLVFFSKDVVSVKVHNVDLDFASKDTFLTDAHIAANKVNGQASDKELEPWVSGEGTSGDGFALADESANGWDVHEMFKKNKEKYGVQTTYTPEMVGYTTALKPQNTPEYKEREAEAQRIASQIHSSPTSQIRADAENGDEEEKLMPMARQDGTKYIHPNRRKPQGGCSGGSSMNKQASRGTPSPQGCSRFSGPAPVAPPPLPSQSGPSQTFTSKSGGSGNSSSGGGVPSSGPPASSGTNYQPHGSQGNNMPIHRSNSKGSQFAHSPETHVNVNGDPKDSKKVEESEPPVKEPVHAAPSTKGESYGHDSVGPPPPPHPAPAHIVSGPPASHVSNSSSQHDHRKAGPDGRDHRESRKPHGSHRNPSKDHLTELVKFMKDFNLSSESSEKDGQVHAPHSSGQPPPSAAPQLAPAQQKGHPAPAPSQPPPAPAPAVPPQQSPNTKSQHQPPLHRTASHGSVLQPQHSVPPPTQHNQPPTRSTPPQSIQSPPPAPPEKLEEVEKPISAVTTSKLNPNAKEFVFNPSAKSFNSRSPSTQNPSRPHTPQTPQVVPQPPPPGPQMNCQVPYMYASSYPMAQAPQPRFGKRGQRPTDYPSSAHVAAATGSPILAPPPQSLPTVIPQPHQQISQYGFPMVLRVPHVQPFPTSMSGIYPQPGDAQQPPQQTCPPTVYMSSGPLHFPGPNALPVSHPTQPPTPQGGHSGASGGAPGPPSMPPQPPTPGPTTPQPLLYGSHPGPHMGAQPTLPQHFPQQPQHTAPSPHNPQFTSHAALQQNYILVPPGAMPGNFVHSGGQPSHSTTAHIPSSMAGFAATSTTAVQHINPPQFIIPGPAHMHHNP